MPLKSSGFFSAILFLAYPRNYKKIMGMRHFPRRRMHRLRHTQFLCDMVCEAFFTPDDFIHPFF
jgi:hypothetical protein